MDTAELLGQYIQQYSPDVFHTFLERLADEFHLLANPSRPIPISRGPLLMEKEYVDHFRRATNLIWGVLNNRGYQNISAGRIPRELLHGTEEVLAIPLDTTCNIGCIDFHLSNRQLKVIEYMALPPGMIGIYPGLLARYGEFLADTIPGFHPLIYTEGWDRARCEQAMVAHIIGKSIVDGVAIIDWNPESQITHGEFLYTKKLLATVGNGITCTIADPREVTLSGGRPWVHGRPVDRILNRVTLVDWMDHLGEVTDYTRILWECPEVFVYHPFLWYLADKNSLTLLSSPKAISVMGIDQESIKGLTDLVPKTRMLSDFSDTRTGRVQIDRLIEQFGPPETMVLKPVSSHASKGVLYGPLDFPSREKMAERLSSINPTEYVVMERIPPGEVLYPMGNGLCEAWRYDLRAYVFDNSLWFAGGRVYLGEYTNQLPVRNFAPLFFVV